MLLRGNLVKFKIGDKVRILSLATSVCVESEDVGKVGVINLIDEDVNERRGIRVLMQEVCKARGCICRWNVGDKMIEPYPRKGEQLLFDFMLREE